MDGRTAEIMPGEVVLESFVAIIDLREGDAPIHKIAGSVRIDRLDLDRMEALAPSPDAPVLLYCGIGEVSRNAARSLSERGYTGFVSLLGGFRRWQSEERPIVAADSGATDRYDRHIRLVGFGQDGQDRIRASNVLVVGAGGLGSPVIQYLSAAGRSSRGTCSYPRCRVVCAMALNHLLSRRANICTGCYSEGTMSSTRLS